MGQPQVSAYERGKAVADKSAAETNVWLRLDLLQGLLAEIERLQKIERRQLKHVLGRAEDREEEHGRQA